MGKGAALALVGRGSDRPAGEGKRHKMVAESALAVVQRVGEGCRREASVEGEGKGKGTAEGRVRGCGKAGRRRRRKGRLAGEAAEGGETMRVGEPDGRGEECYAGSPNKSLKLTPGKQGGSAGCGLPGFASLG